MYWTDIVRRLSARAMDFCSADLDGFLGSAPGRGARTLHISMVNLGHWNRGVAHRHHGGVKAFEVAASTEANETLSLAGSFLSSDPIRHNVVLSLLEERASDPEEGRYWTVLHGGEVAGVAFQSPTYLVPAITPMESEAVSSLVK